MQFNINIRALTAEAFGYAASRLLKLDTVKDDASEGVGYFGKPVFSKVVFPAGSYEENGQTIQYDGVEIIDPLVTIGDNRQIVTTSIQGKKGTVKEFISNGDYAVTIQGLLYDAQNLRAYPARETQKLREVCEAPIALPVTGRMFKLFGISNLVIMNARYQAVQGFTNLQAFELQCISDDALELQILDA
jgi:hypothetical protein